jgi:outer membrane protein OmpA-like peptidoglycan-associated protein/Tol biopolymer transport system component
MRIAAISLLMALQLSVIPLFGQSPTPQADALVDEGDVLFKNKGGKREALARYKEAIKLSPDHVRANYMAGLCYLQTSEKSFSLTYFMKAHDIEPDYVPEIKVGVDLFPDLLFLIAKAYQVGGNYTKANEYYQHFKEAVQQGSASRYALINKGPANRAAERSIFECLVAEELSKKPLDSRIQTLKGLNSPYPDYGPVLTPDGNTMYFTSRRANGNSTEIDDDLHFFEDIYVARRDSNGRWGNVQLVKELGTTGHESVVCLSEDGKTMILSRGEGNGDLFMSNMSPNGLWSEPVSMGKNINSNGRETAAYLFAKGRKLIFTSDRSGGFGGSDLYLSERRSNGKWGSAVNLGPKVNTMFDEDAPSLDQDGKVLYFSSKGHKSMGGFDVFKARWDENDQIYKSPENLGFPLNSADDDNTFIQSPTEPGVAYYASFKENGEGDLDIFTLLPGPPIPDSVKKEQEAFKELAKENKPLMEDRVNDLAKDSSAKAAEEADRIAQREAMQKAALASSAPPSESETPEPTDNTANAMASKGFEVKLMEEEPINNTVANGQGYFMYDPLTDLQASDSRKETAVRILILDTDTRIPLDGEVVFTDQDTKEEIKPTRVRNGVFEVTLRNNTAKDYMVSVEKEGFHFKNIIVSVPPASQKRSIFLTRNIELKRHTLNKARILRNVYFDFDQDNLSDRSNKELDMLYNMLKDNEKLVIEVSGHADFLGQDEYNDQLSKRRAEKVVAYLTSKGIDQARLRAQGYGEKKPAPGTDNSESGRALNRRTEFMILAH